MTDYIKTELGPDGIAALKGVALDKVNERSEASEFSYGDAQFFERRAFEHWPDLLWDIAKVGAGKYIVKAEGQLKGK
jgi:hypothetical protein